MRDFNLNVSRPTAAESTKNTDIQESDFDEKKVLKDVEELLVDSLIAHTQAVRPPGLFLSGGVDSTLLLALADKHRIFLPYVFSIVNGKNDRVFGTDDFKYTRLAIEKFHPSADIVELDHSIMHDIPDFIGKIDHPVGDPAYFLTHKLASRAAATTNVVLSGAGADELFGGYNRHIAFFYYLKYFNKTKAFIPLIKNSLRILPSGFSFAGRKTLVLLKKLSNKVEPKPWQTYDNFLALEKLHPDHFILGWDMNKMNDPLNENLFLALERDRQEYLPEDVLAISDRACMLNSVEMRMPYLDENIVNYIRGIKPFWLLAGGRKWILKSILKKYGGKQFADRPKEGFGFPFGHWIKNPEYSDLVSSMTNEKNLIYNFVDREMIMVLIQDHFSGRDDNAQEIWSFLLLNGWIEKNFN
jgi:asparagine synthase (glutamine-hydrolysing)